MFILARLNKIALNLTKILLIFLLSFRSSCNILIAFNLLSVFPDIISLIGIYLEIQKINYSNSASAEIPSRQKEHTTKRSTIRARESENSEREEEDKRDDRLTTH